MYHILTKKKHDKESRMKTAHVRGQIGNKIKAALFIIQKKNAHKLILDNLSHSHSQYDLFLEMPHKKLKCLKVRVHLTTIR